MISEYRCVAVVPEAVDLDEVPEVAVCLDRVSLDHEVGDAGDVEKHFRAREINVAVAASSRESAVSRFLKGIVRRHRLVADVRVHPVKDLVRGVDIVVAPEVSHDVFGDLVRGRRLVVRSAFFGDLESRFQRLPALVYSGLFNIDVGEIFVNDALRASLDDAFFYKESSGYDCD